MLNYNNGQGAISYANAETNNKVVTRVFIWMTLGLIISSVSAFLSIYLIASRILSTSFIFPALILEFIIAIALGAGINKMSAVTAKICFIFYSILTGFSLSPIFIAYDIGMIAYAFIAASAMFGVMAIYGAVTKKDLSTFGTVGLMLLAGIIITTLLNVFIFKSSGLELFLLYAGLTIFAGITAYDMQKIKSLAKYAENAEDKSTMDKVVILGALNLYLDFINIFVRILSIFSRRRD